MPGSQPKHGESAGSSNGTTVEYQTWLGMKRRCYNESCKSYKNYGGRGIKVCERWLLSYEHFLSDMGRRPQGYASIDRVNNDGDYEPGNCRWSNHAQQATNTRLVRLITHNGMTLPLSEWARRLGMKQPTLSVRLNKLGWSLSDVMSRPLRSHRPYRTKQKEAA